MHTNVQRYIQLAHRSSRQLRTRVPTSSGVCSGCTNGNSCTTFNVRRPWCMRTLGCSLGSVESLCLLSHFFFLMSKSATRLIASSTCIGANVCVCVCVCAGVCCAAKKRLAHTTTHAVAHFLMRSVREIDEQGGNLHYSHTSQHFKVSERTSRNTPRRSRLSPSSFMSCCFHCFQVSSSASHMSATNVSLCTSTQHTLPCTLKERKENWARDSQDRENEREVNTPRRSRLSPTRP